MTRLRRWLCRWVMTTWTDASKGEPVRIVSRWSLFGGRRAFTWERPHPWMETYVETFTFTLPRLEFEGMPLEDYLERLERAGRERGLGEGSE